MNQFTIVGLSGGLSSPSRTLSLVALAVDAVARASGRAGLVPHSRIIDVAALPDIGQLRSRAGAGAPEEEALRAVEQADLLIVGSPVYKGSYSGLFKHFIDLVDYRSLIGTPVALLATGGSERHALAIEHQLRPLFAFFQAQPLGTGLFLTERELVDGGIVAEPAQQRLERLVEEAVHAVEGRVRARHRAAGAAA